MAGVKGRSGGARPGSGRKPKAQPPSVRIELEAQPHGGALKRASSEAVPADEAADMLDLLQKVALGHIQSTPLQVRAAIAAVQYTHTKKGDGGKKEGQGKLAEKAAGGRFAPSAPPKLAAVK